MEQPSNSNLASDATINDEKDSLLQHLINFADTGA
jgi:hypothetical protein